MKLREENLPWWGCVCRGFQSLIDELETPGQVLKGTLTGLRGLLKKDGVSPTDAEVEAVLQERREEKYR